jgi:hypothetical protein
MVKSVGNGNHVQQRALPDNHLVRTKKHSVLLWEYDALSYLGRPSPKTPRLSFSHGKMTSASTRVQQNLTLSWSRLLDIFQLLGWMVLLFGYLYLFLKESRLIP